MTLALENLLVPAARPDRAFRQSLATRLGEAVVAGVQTDGIAHDERHRLDLDLGNLASRHRSFRVKEGVIEFVDQRLDGVGRASSGPRPSGLL